MQGYSRCPPIAGQDPGMIDDHDEGMATGGLASDGVARSSMATPPLTDGQPMPPDTDQV